MNIRYFKSKKIPAAFLKPGEKLTHTQRIFHITGDETALSSIPEKLFNVSIVDIVAAFSNDGTKLFLS